MRLLIVFVLYLVNASAVTIFSNINSIYMLDNTNFKIGKRKFLLFSTTWILTLHQGNNNSSYYKNEHKRWEHSNLMMMKGNIPEAFRRAMSDEKNAKKFFDKIEKYFAKNKKAETSTLLANIVLMKYKGKGNIRKYITQMSIIT